MYDRHPDTVIVTAPNSDGALHPHCILFPDPNSDPAVHSHSVSDAIKFRVAARDFDPAVHMDAIRVA
jgi:hypothetical protein